MDFKGFKKVKEDGKTVTLAHPKGHQITVIVSKLKPIEKEAIKRMKLAYGGDVDADPHANEAGVNKEDELFPKQGQSKAGAMIADKTKNPNREEKTQNRQLESKAKGEHRKTLADLKAQPKPKLQNFDDGGDVAPDAAPVPQADPTPAGPTGIQAEAQKSLDAIGTGAQAIQDQRAIDVQKAQAMQDAEAQHMREQKDIADQNAAALTDVTKHTNDYRDYINANPVDAQRYQHNMSGGQKTSTAIGLMLGGLSNGLIKQGNPAMDFLNKQIDRDVDAQKTNISNQHNVYNAYQQLYGDSNVSTALAKVSSNDKMANAINLAAAKLGTPQAAVNAKLATAKLMADSDALRQNAAGAIGDLYRSGKLPAQQKPTAQPQVAPVSVSPQAPSGNQSVGAANVTPTPLPSPAQSNADYMAPTAGILLHKGAEKAYQGLQYHPKAKEQMGEITKQFTAAQQADKSLSQVAETFNNLTKERSMATRINQGVNPHAIAASLGAVGTGVGAAVGAPLAGVGAIPGAVGGGTIGTAIGEGIGHGIQGITNTDNTRRYQADKSALFGYLSSAVSGRGSEAIGALVDANTPEYGDSKATLKQKFSNIQDFIKNHTETSLLKTWHLTNG